MQEYCAGPMNGGIFQRALEFTHVKKLHGPLLAQSSKDGKETTENLVMVQKPLLGFGSPP